MPYSNRPYECVTCGNVFIRRGKSAGLYRCLPCAVLHAVEQMVQMHYHQGEHWDAWRKSMRTFLDLADAKAQARQFPPSPEITRVSR